MRQNTDEDRRWAPIKVALMRRDPKESYREALCRLLPVVSERVAYRDWSRAQIFTNSGFYLISRDFFVEMVENLNFFSPGDRATDYCKWQTGSLMVKDSPRVPLGSTTNALYRLEPDVYSLLATKRPDVNIPLLKNYCFLGIKTKPSPRSQSQREANKSGKAHYSSNSDDPENGFMFHQLGEVTTWPIRKGAAIPANDSPIHDEDWKPTGYVLVARLNTSGRAESLYLIFNTWPFVEEIGERVEVKDPDWGHLPYEPNSCEHMSFARLYCSKSSLLSDRDYSTPFEWGFEDADEEAASKGPVELVRLVETDTRDGCVLLTEHHDAA
ncbi:hypothetical protein HDK77DRAFT_73206 [Phyllosticta capitalensis]|uniref:Uncharacterized protein n=1 Tax=Phyllosticta capitalensis TaxID=121624 RepID=A0ABR1YQ05_9PEZI